MALKKFQLSSCIVLCLSASIASPTLGTPTSAPVLKSLDLEVVRGSSALLASDISSKTATAINQGNCSALEKMARQYEKDPRVLIKGYTPQSVFYRCFSPDRQSDNDYQKRIQLVATWRKIFPTSECAAVAQAGVMAKYAWFARGGGYIDTVTSNGAQKFQSRLQNAKTILLAVPEQKRSAQWFVQMQDVSLGLEWDDQDKQALFEQAIKMHPNETEFYFSHAWQMLPRWGGGPGDWTNFALESSRRVGGDKGLILYTRIISDMHHKTCDSEDLSGVIDDRFQKGCALLAKAYPGDSFPLSEEAWLALDQNNKIKAQRLFGLIGNKVSYSTWNSKFKFMQARKKAFE